jgi:formimidoylglutamate deiminase
VGAAPLRPFIATAELGVVEVDGRLDLVEAPRLHVGPDGTIREIQFGAPPEREGASEVPIFDLGHQLLLPGFVNAHSHAFQRVIRGATGRRADGDPSSFWSWREAMYSAANRLDPDEFQRVTRDCFAEMLASGITTVGEFHYVHHSPDGHPYDDPNELSNRVIAAASEVGLRLTLLEVFYARAGAGQEPLPEQRRFCDASVEAYLERVDALRARAEAQQHGMLGLGLAPHSARAVGLPALSELARYANRHDLPIHAHVSEQTRENELVALEHGCSPVSVFARGGCLDRPGAFTAVHAIHLDDADHEQLSEQNVCACPTTEADLGDGIIPAARHLSSGTNLCLGSDSNSVVDLIQEARLLEMHERLGKRARLCLSGDDGRVSPALMAAIAPGGALALGRPSLGKLAVGSPFDAVSIDLEHRTLRDVPREFALDSLLLAGTAAPVDQVWVGGQRRH